MDSRAMLTGRIYAAMRLEFVEGMCLMLDLGPSCRWGKRWLNISRYPTGDGWTGWDLPSLELWGEVTSYLDALTDCHLFLYNFGSRIGLRFG
jgi:hypothetical protein